MLEARFDDLSRASGRSFRLTEPVGVLEARRPDEVPHAIEAAEAASSRGLWVAGLVTYEAAPALDPALQVRARAHADPFAQMPLAWFAMFQDAVETSLAEPSADGPGIDIGASALWRPSIDRPAYDAAIGRIRELIAAGESYQVNFTLRLRAGLRGDERGLYRDLALAQRGAHAAYLNLGRYRVLSASPELFFRIDGDRITTRPMKGTTPRGRWREEDQAAAARLRGSAKDRAENAMIVDLLRNDLGRISQTGSVHVPSMFEAERYETVWQLTSTVASTLRPRAALVDVFRALFPSGSVTGAPKIRSMQLICELEDSSRGVYTGAVGYLAPSGSGGPRASFNVAIRTVMVDADTKLAEFGVGGGITFDSTAEAEYDEVLTKARVLAARRPRFDLLEAMRHDPVEGTRHLGFHLDRLAASAEYFGFAYDQRYIREAIEKAAEGVREPCRLRLTLSREGAADVTVSETPPPPSLPVRLAVHPDPVDPSDPFLFHKTTRRDVYERAAAGHPSADDVVLVNTRGEVTETTVANLAVRIDGAWWTPAIECGLLRGTGRAAALDAGVLRERTITVAELQRAEEIALVSSVRGWRPAILDEEA